MSLFILFSTRVMLISAPTPTPLLCWGGGVRECLGGHLTSSQDRPMEPLEVSFGAITTSGESQEVFLPTVWSSSGTNSQRAEKIPKYKEKSNMLICFARGKLQQENNSRINVLISQNQLQWIITLSSNCKHGYYCDRLVTQKRWHRKTKVHVIA